MLRDDDLGSALWYQYAAVAYGWDPETNELRANAIQAAMPFDEDLSAELLELFEKRRGAIMVKGQYAEPSPNTFFNEAFQHDVLMALADDGVSASFKLPLPACKAPGGKARPPVRRNGKWECEPIYADLNPLPNIPWGIVLVLGIGYLISKGK